jgi:AFG3 family protein
MYYGAPQQQGFYQPQQFQQPPQFYQPQQQLFQQPMYVPPLLAPALPPSAANDQDYYKGFYEGVIRNSGPNFGSAASWFAPLVVNLAFFIGPIWYIRRKYMQSMGTAAASAVGDKAKNSNPMSAMMEMMNPMKAKQFRVEVKGTTFNEVIGIPEAKEDLKQYVDFLKDPSKFTRLGARLPKGCLLTGQPGTGKTLLARAVAGEADKPFFSCSGADFIEVFGGSGPKRVRELFAEARAAAPCVVFIDEIDAIGSRNSGRSMGGGSSEENRTINQLLAELDGLSSKETIVVIAATNYPDAIDKALLREGRFDRKVTIPMPDKAARSDLFEFYLNRVITGDANCKPKIMKMKERVKEGEDAKKVEEARAKADADAAATPVPIKIIPGVSNKESAAKLADRTPGVSPAQISTIVNEAALACAVNNSEVVGLKELQDAIDDVLIGKKHRQRMSSNSLRRTAYHECGHALMAWINPLQKDVIKISIIPRGRAGGYTQQTQDEALDPHTDQFLFSQLCVLLGGRVAERVVLGDISTGALDDLQRATKIAMDTLLSYGMSKEIGQLAFKQNDKNDGRAWMNYSEQLHAKVEDEARALVRKAYVHTEVTLLAKKEKLAELSELLLEKKELMQEDITKVLGPRPKAA